jgi:hypothetical protein
MTEPVVSGGICRDHSGVTLAGAHALALAPAIPEGRCPGRSWRQRSSPICAGVELSGARRHDRLTMSGPGAWQVGMISMRFTFMCDGSPSTQEAASAISSADKGSVPV